MESAMYIIRRMISYAAPKTSYEGLRRPPLGTVKAVRLKIALAANLATVCATMYAVN